MLVLNNENACCRSQISLYYDHVDIRYHFIMVMWISDIMIS